jgi:hypothetical protein
MILEPWMPKNNPNKETCIVFINHKFKLANHSVKDSNFTGSPLYIKMIATGHREVAKTGIFQTAIGY